MANGRGEVLLDSNASVGGSYTGVFPAGLLTNLAPAPGAFPFLRLYKKDPEQPYQVRGFKSLNSFLGTARRTPFSLIRYIALGRCAPFRRLKEEP